MNEIVEAVGTAAEGGLYARAVDHKGSGDGPDRPLDMGHFAEDACLNCGTQLTGAHCHACGQKAHLHRTIGAFMHDFAHGAVHFDSKTWRTLPKLAFKPGELTRRYIDGERTRFVSPMALFLFSIFLMFAVFQFAGISAPTDLQGDTSGKLRELAASEVSQLQDRQTTLAGQIADEEISDAERSAAQQELDEIERQLSDIDAAQENIPFLKGVLDGTGPSGENATGGAPVTIDEDGSRTVPLTRDGKTKMKIEGSGIDWIDNGLKKWRDNPGLMLYKLQTNFYKFSWLLIPLSIPFVWLLFAWKRRFKAYDHAIFVTYSLSFMTLLTLAIVLAGLAGVSPGVVVFASMIIPPVHIYKQLRRTYGLSRFSAFWRLCVLTIFIFVVLTLFIQALLLIGAF